MRCMHAMVMGVKDEIRVSNGIWLWKMRNALNGNSALLVIVMKRDLIPFRMYCG